MVQVAEYSGLKYEWWGTNIKKRTKNGVNQNAFGVDRRDLK